MRSPQLTHPTPGTDFHRRTADRDGMGELSTVRWALGEKDCAYLLPQDLSSSVFVGAIASDL